MKILFIGRIDFPEKSGGDGVQMYRYKEWFESNGNKVTLFTKNIYGYSFDTIHLFNVDKIYELLYQLSFVKLDKNTKLILHTIHQKKTTFRKAILSSRLGNTTNAKIFNILKFYFKILKYKRVKLSLFPLIFSIPFIKYDQFLNRVSYYHFLSKKEKKWFEKDYCYTVSGRRSIVFPNGIEKNVFFNKNKPLLLRKIDIIIVGRIEPMKNTLNAVKFLKEHFSQKNIVICGKENPYYKSYMKLFFSEIDNCSQIKYIGEVNKNKLSSLLNDSKILILPSLNEVYPLVEIESINCGCIVVGTKYSASDLCHKNYDSYFQCNPYDLENIKRVLDKIFIQINKKHRFNYPTISSWDKVLNNLKI
ncbi:MAG: glycosyltransferase family 4 protein [Candidatus Marinimicrobia bacterium]|nr:glycosyltransferase family 4 protein [Candidatus Neomarinimicrobiota bacterium]